MAVTGAAAGWLLSGPAHGAAILFLNSGQQSAFSSQPFNYLLTLT
ncbi:hypothetical protein PLANPX_5595 [Lacipirellula parvula]|uniref:Uncharacterized protein n=1 Tax=Lacipirellula parvula TaxID=2650471 RepID=A0A5K7XMS3_9BACT|nr:hypothetical protein PLANPX_5595 [Lacipirellula parvula]